MIQDTFYTGTLASVAVDQQHEQFSLDALAAMCTQAVGKLVLWQFEAIRPLGVVDAACLYETSLHVILRLSQPLPVGDFGPLYVVPSFMSDEQGESVNGVRVFHDVQLMSVGITHDPLDVTLMPLRRLGPLCG